MRVFVRARVCFQDRAGEPHVLRLPGGGGWQGVKREEWFGATTDTRTPLSTAEATGVGAQCPLVWDCASAWDAIKGEVGCLCQWLCRCA